jgi:hypothetical protein
LIAVLINSGQFDVTESCAYLPTILDFKSDLDDGGSG